MKNTPDNPTPESEPAEHPAFDPASMTPGRWTRVAAKRKRALAREYYRSLDATAREGISDEDYATTMTTLETMARNLGWDESQGVPRHGGWRGHGPHRGFGPGFGRGFGRGFGPGWAHHRKHGHDNTPA